MPDSENFPAWGRIPIRAICTVQYVLLAVLAGHAALTPPRAIAALVGVQWATGVAAVTATAFVVAAIAHGWHKWLVERGAVPFGLAGVLTLDVMLWAAVPNHQADPASALMLLILALGLLVRAIGLEVFAHQHRPTWRRNAGRS